MKATSPLKKAYGRFKAIIFATVVFSFFSNLLMFVGPLYMLQVYDRVLGSRSEETLVALLVLVMGLYGLMWLLDFARSRLLRPWWHWCSWTTCYASAHRILAGWTPPSRRPACQPDPGRRNVAGSA